MTVRDYNNDMVLGQKWAVEVRTELAHDFAVDTYHYSVPLMGKCPYFDDTVSYFRVIGNEIILVVKKCDCCLKNWR